MKRALLAAAAIATAVFLLVQTLPLQSFEGLLLDYRYISRAQHNPVPPDPRIRVILLEKETEEWLAAEPRVFWLPHLSKAAEELLAAGVLALGFDMIPQYPVSEQSFRYRELMAHFVGLTSELAFEESSPLIMAVHLEVTDTIRAIMPSPPITMALGSQNLGLAASTPDPDGVVRKQLVTPSNFGAESLDVYPYLSALLAERATGQSHSGVVQVNFAGALEELVEGKAFPTYSLAQVVKFSPQQRKDEFEGAIVLLGSGSVADLDIVTSPFSRAHTKRAGMQSSTSSGMLGVLYQAHVLHTLLTNSSLETVSKPVTWALTWSVFFLFSLATYSRETTTGLAMGVTLLCLAGGMGWSLFVSGNLILPLAPIFVGWVFTFAATYMVRFWFEERQRKVVQDLFGRYVARDVMEQLLAEPSKAALGATEQKEVTVFFSDINGFSTIAEQFTPAEVMDMVNEYFTEMTAILFRTQGTIKQFVGDEIMAVYGAPKDHPTPADSAVTAALDMVDRLAQLETESGRPGFYSVKCGIHTGQVIAGNVGSEERKEWAVVGDDVNLASRIMSLTKSLDCAILISETTYQQVKDTVEADFVDHGVQNVKGREGGVRVYEVRRA